MDAYGPLPDRLGASWYVEIRGTTYDWNPINPVPEGATHLVFAMYERNTEA